jgi:hypothetical protein
MEQMDVNTGAMSSTNEIHLGITRIMPDETRTVSGNDSPPDLHSLTSEPYIGSKSTCISSGSCPVTAYFDNPFDTNKFQSSGGMAEHRTIIPTLVITDEQRLPYVVFAITEINGQRRLLPNSVIIFSNPRVHEQITDLSLNATQVFIWSSGKLGSELSSLQDLTSIVVPKPTNFNDPNILK